MRFREFVDTPGGTAVGNPNTTAQGQHKTIAVVSPSAWKWSDPIIKEIPEYTYTDLAIDMGFVGLEFVAGAASLVPSGGVGTAVAGAAIVAKVAQRAGVIRKVFGWLKKMNPLPSPKNIWNGLKNLVNDEKRLAYLADPTTWQRVGFDVVVSILASMGIGVGIEKVKELYKHYTSNDDEPIYPTGFQTNR